MVMFCSRLFRTIRHPEKCASNTCNRLVSVLLVIVSSSVASARVLNGTYTIVNKASGRRICSGFNGFSATTGDTIQPCHRWRLVPQGDEAYVIENVANRMRIFAQIGDGHHGFLTIDQGPVYEDQKWWLVMQDDASYMLVNARSGRRMTARAGLDAALGFFAEAEDGPALDEHAWWLIDPDRDEAGPIVKHIEDGRQQLKECRSAAEKMQRLAHDIAKKDEEILQLSDELSAARTSSTDRLPSSHTEPSDVCGVRDLTSVVALFKVASAWQDKWASNCPTAVYLPLLACLLGLFVYTVHRWARRKRSTVQASLAAFANTSSADHLLPATDITYGVFPTHVDGEPARIIKIQCPGVEHGDVEIELIWNGCEVKIQRQASLGVQAVSWTRRFQFLAEEGLFEFREDQMHLEHGFLQLVLRSYAFHGRAVRFPQHFSLASTDTDLCWDYTDESCVSEVSGSEVQQRDAHETAQALVKPSSKVGKISNISLNSMSTASENI